MVQSSLTSSANIPGVLDRLKARNGATLDPLAAIKRYEDLPAVIAAPNAVTATRSTSTSTSTTTTTPEPIADDDVDDDSDASGLYDGLDLAFDPAKLSWLIPNRGTVTGDHYLALSPDLSAVRLSRAVRLQIGEAGHIQFAFAADDLIVLRITRNPKNNKHAIKVRTNGTIGMKWLANEMSVRGWKHGRYTVHRAAPDYFTVRLKERIGDCAPANRPAPKTKPA